MVPEGKGTPEPEPEDTNQESQIQDEPSTDHPTSRYPDRARSLGLKYPGIFSDSMFRSEGMLVWLY